MPIDLEANQTSNQISSEYVASWRNLIFLPFHSKWNLVIHLTIIISASFTTFDIVYVREDDRKLIFDQVYYICELLFLVDTVLAIMHR